MNELFIEAKTENLDAVLEFVSRELETADCPMKSKAQITLAVEEIFVNIAHYAYTPGAGCAAIRVTVGEEAVIEFEDGGKPYNPLESEAPDITADAEERRIGGLGIFIARNIMDAMEYRREEDKNILVIKKTLMRM